MTDRRAGKWHIEYEFAGVTHTREVDDANLLRSLGDRFGIVNKVVYVGPEVDATNRLVDSLMKRGEGR